MIRLLPALAAASLASAGCTEYAYTSKTQKDVFQQVQRKTVDILLVVDNSCSMAEEQDKLASNFDAFIQSFQGVDVDWQIGVTTTDTEREDAGQLLGGDDEIILQDPSGSAIDQVSFDRSWPIEPGVALQLSRDAWDSSDNAGIDAWCLADASYGDGDRGSPGEENVNCDGSAFQDDGGQKLDAGPRAPEAGEVVIVEFLADPAAVSDSAGEWVELANVSDDTLDLSGHVLADSGRNAFAFPDGTLIAPGEIAVVGRAADGNGGLEVDIVAEEGFTLNNDVVILTPAVDGADEIFAEMVALGTTGAGIEQGLHAAYLALSEPLLSGGNAGFLRDDANLSLLFVSDEEDSSPLSIYDYQRHFTDLEGEEAYRDHQRMNISGVVGMDEPAYEGMPSCESSNGVADYGARYVELIQRTEGALESICEEDFSPIAAEIGLTISGLVLEFELSGLPDLDTLEVRLYESEDEESLIETLAMGEDYEYVAERNAIRFQADQVPASETYIVAEYRVLAEGSEIQDEGEAE